MFENLIGQEVTRRRLETELSRGKLPQALLFYGPLYSGKQTAALELARILSCSREAAWNCGCRNCVEHRLLSHHGLVLMGEHSFMAEILAASVSLKTTQKLAVRYLFCRAVRKLLRRFDPVLWPDETAKLKRLSPLADSVAERLEPLLPGSSSAEPESLDAHIDALTGDCGKLVSSAGSFDVGVDQVRSLSSWLRSTTAIRPKVVVIEEADRLLEGARNALLKILEEPPQDVYFILLTQRRGAIIPTILSRTRAYPFGLRRAEDEQRVMSMIFRDSSGQRTSLREFFLHHEYAGEYRMKETASHFLESVLGSQDATQTLNDVRTLVGSRESAEGLRHFCEELVERMRALLLAQQDDTHPPLSWETMVRWQRLVQDHLARHEVFNISAANVVESLFYKMRS